MADTSFQTLFNKLVHKFEGASVSTNAPSKKSNRVQFSDFLKTRYPQTALPPTPEPIDQYNPKQINSLYDVLSHTYQTAAYTSFRNGFKYISQNPQDAYYIKKYGLENYFRNVGITEYNWTKNRQVWNTFINEHLTKPFKMLTDESVPFRTRISNYGNHLLTAGLTSFGETADILANIVKAALPNKLTHYEEKYPELKGMSKTERIFAGIFGLDATKDIPLSDAFKYFQRPGRLRTPANNEKYYKQIADALQKKETSIDKTFSRYTFDFDINLDDDPNKNNVGEFILNMAGEFFSDPLNILEVGGSIADAVGGNKAIFKALTKNGDEVYNKAIPELIQSGTLKWDNSTARWFKELLEKGTIDQNTFDAFERIGRNAAAQAGDALIIKKSLQDIFFGQTFENGSFKRLKDISRKSALRDALYSSNRDEFISAFKTYMGAQYFSDNTLEKLYKNKALVDTLGGNLFDVVSEALVHKANFRILAGIHGLAEGADTLDKAIIKLAGMPVMTPVVTIFKTFGGTKFIKYIGASTVRHLGDYQLVTKEGADLGASMLHAEDIYQAIKKDLDSLKLANVDMAVDSPKAAEDMLAELAKNSLEAQVKYFNVNLNAVIKKYSDEALKDPEKLKELVEEIRNTCNVFLTQTKAPKKINAVEDMRGFIKYLDDLMIEHPEMQFSITSKTIHTLEKIAKIDDLADELKNITVLVEAFNTLNTNIDFPLISVKTPKKINATFKHIFKLQKNIPEASTDIYSFFGGIRAYLIKINPDITIPAVDVARKIDPGSIQLTPNETRKIIARLNRNIKNLKVFTRDINALLYFFENFDYNQLDSVQRNLDGIFRILGRKTDRINQSVTSLNDTFSLMRTNYQQIHDICKEAHRWLPNTDAVEDLSTKQIKDAASIMNEYYTKLYQSITSFQEYYDKLTKIRNNIVQLVTNDKQNVIDKLIEFTFTKEMHTSRRAAYDRINALFGNSESSKLVKLGGLPEKINNKNLYDTTIKEIRSSAKSYNNVGAIISHIDNFVGRTHEFIEKINDFSTKYPQYIVDFPPELTDVLTELNKYTSAGKDLPLEDLTFKGFKDLIDTIGGWMSAVTSAMFEMQSEAVSDPHKVLQEIQKQIISYQNVIFKTDEMFSSKLPFFSDLDLSQGWVQLHHEHAAGLHYTLSNPLTAELDEIRKGTSKIISQDDIERINKMYSSPDSNNPVDALYDWLDSKDFIEDFILDAQINLPSTRHYRAFLETLMNYSQNDLSNLATSKFQFGFFNNMCINLDSRYSPRRASLDDFRIHGNTSIIPENIKYRTLHLGHIDPGSDTLALKYKVKSDLTDLDQQISTYLEKHPGRNAKFFDIETVYDSNTDVMSSNKYGGCITQISLTDYDSDTTKVYRLKTNTNGESIEYILEDSEDIKSYSSMHELLSDFDKALEDTDILIGMNSEQFDVPFIHEQWITEHAEFFKGTNFVDLHAETRDALKQSNFWRITDPQNDVLRQAGGGHFDAYKSIRVENGTIPDASDSSVKETVYALLTKLAAGAQEHNIKNLKLLDEYDVKQVVLDLIYALESSGKKASAVLSKGDELNLGANYQVLRSLLTEYEEGFGTVHFKDMLYRDLTKETVSKSKLDELYRFSRMAPEEVDNLLKQGAHLTDEEYDLLKYDSVEDLRYPYVQSKVKDTWMQYMYYFNSGSKLPFEEWVEQVNLKDPRNLQRILMEANGYLPINYSKITTPGAFDILFDATGKKVSAYDIVKIQDLYTMGDKDTIKKLNNAIKQINDLANRRIKQPEAIFSLGIFDNKEALRKQTEKLITDLRGMYTAAPWIHYIDLKAFEKLDTVHHWFALWYTAIMSVHNNVTENVLKYFKEVFGVYPIQHSYIDPLKKLGIIVNNTDLFKAEIPFEDIKNTIEFYIQDNIFDRVTDTVLDNKGLLALIDDEQMAAHPLYDLFDSDLWQSFTGMQRLDKAAEAIDFIGKGGAKEYARAALIQDFRKVISDINRLPRKYKVAYAQTFAKQLNDISGALNMRFLINAYKNPDSIIADLLYFNGIRIFHLDPELPNTDYSKLCRALIEKQEEYAKIGIQIDYDDASSRLIFRLANNDISTDINTGKISYNGRIIERPEIPVISMTDPSGVIPKEHLDLYTRVMSKNQELFHSNYLGRPLNQENFDEWIATNIPESLKYKETSLDLKKLSEFNFYRGANLRMCEVYDPESIMTHSHIAYSQTVHNFFNNYKHMVNAETGQNLFFDFMLSPTYGMSFKTTEGIFKGLSEKEILQILRNTDDFVPVGIVKDNSIQGFHVVRLQINTVKDVRRAGELNARLIPYQVYSSCFDEINNTLEAAFNKPVTKRGKQLLEDKGIMAYVKTKPLYYARMGLWLYKVGSLMYPGTTLRNLIDSNLKAAIDTGAPIATIRNNFRAMDMMYRYNETIKQFKLYYATPRNPTPSMLKDVYAQFAEKGITPKMTQDEFMFLHSFILNGPSTGETKVLRDWLSSASALGKVDNGGFLQRFADTMLQPMGWVETNARLGQYLTLMEQGVTKTEAFTRISNTAFDYNIKSNVDKFIEYFLPFFNFQKLNAMYWAEALYKYPMAIRFLNDFTKYSWQTFEYDNDYYMSEKSKMYHMMNGNLMIDPAAGMVLKLNPSYMDALNWLYDPANSVIDSLLAPMQNYVNGVMDNDAERLVQQQIEDGTYIIRVGKYKGWTVNEVLEKDPGYLQFALDKEWFKTYDQAAYQSAMLKLSGTPMSITFGNKFNGQPVKVLLKDENRAYAQYLLTQKWFKDMYKPVYDYLVLNKVYEDPVMPFGKFEGKKISEVPDWYFDYIMKNDWMYENYGYLSDAIIEKRNTILPLQDIDFDSKTTYADVSGKFAAGMFIEDDEQANTYIKSIMDMFNMSSTYPVVGPAIQKYITSLFKDEQGNTPYDSASQKNYTRLSKQGTITEARLGALFPDVFGSVTLYERHKQESAIDYSKIPPHISKYRPQDYSDRRNRHYNYYRSARAERYRTYHKHVKPSLDVAQLRLNIAQLHLGV
jgi:uncharacterized protein (DUF3820 family)